MPRKVTKTLVRDIKPDRVYNSVQLQRLINRVMRHGKKQLAERLVYNALESAAVKLKVENPLDVFDQAMKNVQPHVETRSRRVGGANYQIPFEVKGQRQSHLTLMWFVASARGRKGMSMEDRLALEFMDAYNNTGTAVKKREDVHKMAEANRAFAHFARYQQIMTRRQPLMYELTYLDEAGQAINNRNKGLVPLSGDEPRELQFMERAHQSGPDVAGYAVHLLSHKEARARLRAERWKNFYHGIVERVSQSEDVLEVSRMMQTMSAK